MIYRIRNWSEDFETSETRKLKTLTWNRLSNNIAGDGYTELIAHENGLQHYGVWVLILSIASMCLPRGTLVRQSAKGPIPHDSSSIARITRVDPLVVQEAIGRLVEIGWLDEVETIQGVPLEYQGDTSGSPLLNEGRKEGRKEGGKAPKPKPKAPTPDFQSGSSQDQKVISHPAVDWQSRAAGERDDQVPSPGEDFVVLDPAEQSPDPDPESLVDARPPAKPKAERQAPAITTPALKTRLGFLKATYPTARLDTEELRADWQAATEGLTASRIDAIMGNTPCRYPSEFTPRRLAWEDAKRNEHQAVAMNDRAARAKAEGARQAAISAQSNLDSLPRAQAFLARLDAEPDLVVGQEAAVMNHVATLRKMVSEGRSSSLLLTTISIRSSLLGTLIPPVAPASSANDAFPGEPGTAQQAGQA